MELWTCELTALQPGIALLTLFLSRVEVLRHNVATGSEVEELPTAEEMQRWYVPPIPIPCAI